MMCITCRDDLKELSRLQLVLCLEWCCALSNANGSRYIVKSTSAKILPGPAAQFGNPLTEAALHGITRALASVGRAFICLDPSFTILHASHLLDQMLGEGASKALCGRPVEELLGVELFGPRGPLRLALLDGQKREGRRATLKFENAATRLVSITTAPLVSDNTDIAILWCATWFFCAQRMKKRVCRMRRCSIPEQLLARQPCFVSFEW
jgi:hypothetical protein